MKILPENDGILLVLMRFKNQLSDSIYFRLLVFSLGSMLGLTAMPLFIGNHSMN
jgi:hypothetical protein